MHKISCKKQKNHAKCLNHAKKLKNSKLKNHAKKGGNELK